MCMNKAYYLKSNQNPGATEVLFTVTIQNCIFSSSHLKRELLNLFLDDFFILPLTGMRMNDMNTLALHID